VNSDRKVQLIVALLGEFISTTFPVRRLLVVPEHGKVTHLANVYRRAVITNVLLFNVYTIYKYR